MRGDTFSNFAASAWVASCKFATCSETLSPPCRIFAILFATIARCDSFKCRRCGFRTDFSFHSAHIEKLQNLIADHFPAPDEMLHHLPPYLPPQVRLIWLYRALRKR